MARYSIDIKTLRHDAFRDKFFEWADVAYRHRYWAIGVVAALVVITASTFAFFGYQRYAAQRQADDFYAAEKALNAPSAEGTESIQTAKNALQDFLAKYPDGSLSPYAWMYLAEIHWAEKELSKAKEAFRRARESDRATALTRQLATIGEAKLNEAEGSFSAAVRLFESLPDQPYGDLKAFHLGRLAAIAQSPAEAKKQFEKVLGEHPRSGLAAWANDAMAVLPDQPQ
jgi:cytochrome c-type biogenesis protein CcmH/NrfG